MSDPAVQKWIDKVKDLEKAGEYLEAVDRAEKALKRLQRRISHADRVRLQYLQVRTLARSGAVNGAMELYKRHGLDDESIDENPDLSGREKLDIHALWARILKDRALRTPGNGRAKQLAAAARAYEEIFDQEQDSYSGVNAATCYRLARKIKKARELAEETLQACEREFRAQEAKEPGSGDTYWHHATVAEAKFALGNYAEAQSELETAVEYLDPEDFANRASTRKQLGLLCEETGQPETLLDPIAPPDVLFFAGHMISAPGQKGRFPAEQEAEVAAQIRDFIEKSRPGFAYGSLAAGSDILIAEACLEANIDVRIVLPFNKEDFIEVAVKPAGGNWLERFNRCLRKVSRNAKQNRGAIEYATEGAYLGDDSLYTYCAHYAMGLAMVRAQDVAAGLQMLVIHDGERKRGVGTYENIRSWKQHKLPLTTIRVHRTGEPKRKHIERDPERYPPREPHAMLFGDVKGFSSLREEMLPLFHSQYMASLSDVLKSFGRKVLYTNSWGDAIYAVFQDAPSAALCGLELQRVSESFDYAGVGFSKPLRLRLGGHYGPVFKGWDFICLEPTFFGSHVTRAARIEPVTPPGEVYVTQQMAAALAISKGVDIECEYMGNLPSAKKYGAMRMYVLKAPE